MRGFYPTYRGTINGASIILDISKNEAKKLVQALEKEGFLERDLETETRCRNEIWAKDGVWKNTINGNALAQAPAKTISRRKAEEIVQEFLKRVKTVNENGPYLYCVKRAAIFGSFLGDSPVLGDVDIAVEVTRKPYPDEEYEIKAAERRRGRRFSNLVEEIAWPQIEVEKFLRSRQRISLHYYDELENFQKQPDFKYKILEIPLNGPEKYETLQ